MFIGLAIGAVFGVYMAGSDAWLYHAIVPDPHAVGMLSGSMLEQLASYIPLSLCDEIIWRLIIMSGLVWLLANIAGQPQPWCYWVALTLVALDAYPMAHLAYFMALPRVPLTVVRELLLHGAAGMLWGWLYWKRGLFASMTGHVGAHLTLQPILAALS